MSGATSTDLLEADGRPQPPYSGWAASHPVNIRLSLPLGARRYYLTIVGGREKRGPDRRIADRRHYPLRTAANLAFFLVLAGVVYVAGLFAVAVQTSILEF
jgi:hypothetical protein